MDSQDYIQQELIAGAPDWSINQLQRSDYSFHNWYRFVLAFPAHLVRKYILDFHLKSGQTVLDPFAGTGTTLIEAKLLRISSIGIEANPFAHFASSVKTNWSVKWSELQNASRKIAELAKKEIRRIDNEADLALHEFDSEGSALLIKGSISPLPLHKTLVLKNKISQYQDKPYYGHLKLALAKSTVFSASNLRFGPEVGLGKIKHDADVVSLWLNEIDIITKDLIQVDGIQSASVRNIYGDSRNIGELLNPSSIDAVITSPPYPNEKDYSRTTRLESVLLDFIKSRDELRKVKKSFIRSNTRNIYKEDDDQKWTNGRSEVEVIAKKIEKRRKELGKTSGFEKLYPKVTREYFGGIARHLAGLRPVLKPGAKLAYVVGDQASYLRVKIKTGQILAKISEDLGYKVERIDLFRKRFATATKDELREEVVVLTWDGDK